MSEYYIRRICIPQEGEKEISYYKEIIYLCPSVTEYNFVENKSDALCFESKETALDCIDYLKENLEEDDSTFYDIEKKNFSIIDAIYNIWKD